VGSNRGSIPKTENSKRTTASGCKRSEVNAKLYQNRAKNGSIWKFSSAVLVQA